MASLEGKRLASAKGTREGKELRHIITECSECDNMDPIATYCSTCGEFLCSECMKHHRRIRKTKDHVLVDVPKSGVVCSSCDSDDMVKGFCPECTEFLCGECVKHHRRIRKTKHHVLQDINIRAENVKTVKSKQGQSVPIAKPLQTSSVSTPKSSSSDKVKTANLPKPSSVALSKLAPSQARATRSTEIPSKMEIVRKTCLDASYYISKRVIDEKCLVYRYNKVKHLSCTGYFAELGQTSAYEPRPLFSFNHSILTLSYNHVIVSEEGIHVCNYYMAIRSKPHTDDGYRPDRITFVNMQKFVTVCIEQKKIRYHDCKTLQVLSTHDLRSKTSKVINILFSFILCTNTGDILLQTGDRELSQFTAEGVIKCVVPVHGDLFECNPGTVCIDRYNNIFGVKTYSGKIHVFGLKCEHQVLVQIDYVKYVYSAGVDELRNVYITYAGESGGFYIVKYKYRFK